MEAESNEGCYDYRLIFLGEEVTSQRKRHHFFAQVQKTNDNNDDTKSTV